MAHFVCEMCSRGVIASTAIDASVHCIEAYVNVTPKNIFIDSFTLEGMKKVIEWLLKALETPRTSPRVRATAQSDAAGRITERALARR